VHRGQITLKPRGSWGSIFSGELDNKGFMHFSKIISSDSIPIPEGLAPASLSLFDAHLTRLISVYTLAGVHVLAHCRGGVGRAGLVACCWMLKLGLCGWASNTEAAYEGRVRRDTLEQVERAIGIVRRRRSLKAIETYEQVKFLVGYVDYLRGNRS
jgi:protein-tyrosine phosphatase